MAAVGTLTIEMAANVARLQRDMDRATKTVGGAMDRIQKSVQMATRAMGALTAAFAAYKTIQGIIQQADAMTLLNSRLQLVTKSQQEFIRTQEALVSISQRSYTGLSSTVDLYTALSRATANLGVSQNELLRVVETFNKSIIISGGSVEAADAAITQFNQAMASGVLRGEEFNSISEQAPMIMELLANSLGVTRGALRDMAKEGLLVAELVLPALLEGSKSVDDQFAKLNKTVGQSGVQFKNQFALLIDQLNKLTGGTEGASRGLDGLTFNLKILTDLLRAINGPAQAFNETQTETERLLRQNEQAAKANNEAVKSRAKAMLEEKERMEIAKKAAEELQKAYEKLIETLREDIRGSTAALQAEQQGLNKSQEDFLKLVSSPQWYQYTAAQKILITDLFKQRIETEKLIDAEKARAKAAEERLKKMLADEKEFREELAKEDKKNEEDRIKAQEKLYEEHRKQIQKIEDDLTDALMRAFESGKGFGQAFKDTLINMFKTMVLRPILAPIVAGIAGGASSSAMAGTGTMDLISGATQMYNIVTTGFAKVGATVSASLQNAGDYLATSSVDAVAAGGEFLQTIAQGAGPIASAMAGTATGMFLNSMISGGYSMGKGMDTFQKVGIAVASFVGGPVLGAIVGAATGLFNRAFGRKLADAGIIGTFGAEGFQGSSFTFEKGGFFRSDKTRTQGLDPQLQGFLSDSFRSIQSATAVMAITLDRSAEEIFAFTKSIRLSFMGLNQDQIQKLIESTFQGIADELATLALGTTAFSKQGERASETLQRLYQSLITVNSVFDTLNVAMYETSLVTADMASKLIDAFGNIESFVEQTTFFYQEFYSEAERTSTMTRQLTTVMGQLGLALPQTRDQFRALVEAQDLTTEAGRNMYASLVGIAPLFAQISMSAEQAYQEAQNATNFALTALERSVDVQRKALEVNRQLAEENVNNIRSVFETLDSAISNLTGGGFSSATGMAFLEQALTTARTTGYLPGSEELSSAISAVTSGLSPGRFSSSLEFKREQALVLSRLTALREFSEEQLSEAEKQLIAAEQQIEALDTQVQLMREQIMVARMTENSIQGLTGAVLTIPQAISQLQASLSSERTALSTMQTASQSALSAQQQTITVTNKQKDPLTLTTDLYTQAGSAGYIGTETFQGWVDYAARNGAQATIDAWKNVGNRGTTSATFAAGGLHGGGMRLVGERGPELEVTGPARYMSNATLSSMMNNGNGEEVRQLREENKVQMRAMVSLQNRMTKIIEQWNGDGLPTERVEA
jgi:tape measure domain-containing protein